MDTVKADICVIGAGSGGLSVAAGAAQLGARTVLIERAEMGGDCLNYGCVPSKALLAAADAAAAIAGAGRFGVRTAEAEVDGARVFAHVRDVIAAIAPHDSQARFESLGCTVIRQHARFTGPNEVDAGGTRIFARRFVVATGSTPLVPPIPGLAAVPFLTNETIFHLSAMPDHLLILGGGPIGAEMAQAFRCLGSRVTMLEMATLLPKDDPELVQVVRDRLDAIGIEIHERTKVVRAETDGTKIVLHGTRNGNDVRVSGTHLLVAAGRTPAIDGLDLERAGIAYTLQGIRVNARLKTTNRRVYAIGDVVGDLQFTHVANYHASLVIRNALFRLPTRVDRTAVPWVTFTDPELAQVGLTEAGAHAGGIRHTVLRSPFADNDRARTQRRTEGLIKAVVTPGGRILGAAIVGPSAGELILPWVLAIERRLKISALATTIAPYPSLSEISKRAAGAFYTPKLFNERTRWLVRLLSRLG